MKLIAEAPRAWQEVRDRQKIIYLLRNKLAGRPFYVRNTNPPAQVNVNGFTDDSTVHFHVPAGLHTGKTLTIYTTLNRHVEIDLEVVSVPREGELTAVPSAVRIGQDFRHSARLPVRPELLYAKNFQFLKDETGSDKNRVAFEIVFREFEKKLRDRFPGAVITGAGADRRNSDVIIAERKGLPVLVRDSLTPEGFDIPGEGFADFRKELELSGSLNSVILQLRNEKIRSLLALPVRDTDRSQKVIAVVRVTDGEPDRFSADTVKEIAGIAGGIPARIHSLNSITVDKRQDVIDISENGAAFRIDDEVLLKNLPGKKNLTFDLVFRNQPPVRLAGSIKHIHEDKNQLIVGVHFEGQGHSAAGKGTMERFLLYLRNLRKMSESGGSTAALGGLPKGKNA